MFTFLGSPGRFTYVHLCFLYKAVKSISFSITADIDAKTMSEDQTPIHYAAKNNAISSLKILLKLGANLNDRDYKQRTPIFLAAENGNYSTGCLKKNIQVN